MTHNLSATWLTEEELNRIQSKPMRAILAGFTFNRQFPRDIAFGPKLYGGLGLRSLYTEQGVHQLSALIAHIRENSSIGKIILINVNMFQLISGVSKSAMGNPKKNLVCQRRMDPIDPKVPHPDQGKSRIH